MDKSTDTGDFTNTARVTERTTGEMNHDTSMNEDTSSKGLTSNITSRLSGSSLGDARTALMEQARPAVDYVRNNFRPLMDQSGQYVTSARGVITSHPFYAIAGAAAIGVFVGMMFSRPTRSI